MHPGWWVHQKVHVGGWVAVVRQHQQGRYAWLLYVWIRLSPSLITHVILSNCHLYRAFLWLIVLRILYLNY